MTKLFLFNLPDVTCGACIQPIDNALNEQHQIKIKSFSADYLSKLLRIEVEEDIDNDSVINTIINVLDDKGISCQFLNSSTPSIINGQLVDGTQVKSRQKSNVILRHIIKGVIGLAMGATIMGLMLSGIAIPIMGMYAIVGIGSVVTLVLGADSYIEAIKKLFKAKIMTMDSLFTLSTLIVIGVSIAHLFIPWLPMMPEAALMILGFRDFGEALKKSANEKLNLSLSFKDRATKIVKRKCKIAETNEIVWEDISSDIIQPHQIIRIYSGQTIPLDGVCLTSETTIYKTILTGSTEPSFIMQGHEIYAGMVVPEDVDFIEMKVIRSTNDSYLQQQDDQVLRANSEKAPIQTTTNRILQYFVPTVIALAIISGVVMGVCFSPAIAIQCVVSVLVSACPCTLGLITPMAVKVGMSKGIEHRVHFRSGKSLQAATESDVVVFDLNGTLTTGVPLVSQHHIFSKEISEHEFFKYLALLEKGSKKPIGKAIYQYVSHQLNNEEMKDIPRIESHRGIKAIIDAQECLVGNSDYLSQEGILIPNSYELDPSTQVTYVVRNKRIIGCIKTTDPLRKDAKFVVNELKRMGKEVHICTGAERKIACHYAAELGIDPTHVFF